ncbi:hypothetical protein F4804DRAFT_338464 [Jackrogersella minutella]|nr:hypothetical protein F4804DRAFT_338464 [Jackrogersella minutella]
MRFTLSSLIIALAIVSSAAATPAKRGASTKGGWGFLTSDVITGHAPGLMVEMGRPAQLLTTTMAQGKPSAQTAEIQRYVNPEVNSHVSLYG